MEPARSMAQRQSDTLARLANDVDCWVTSASTTGEAYLIPLSYVCYDGKIVFATLTNSLTVRNLRRAGRCRIALDGTRDVVLIEGPITLVPREQIANEIATAFLTVGFDPRQSKDDYTYLLMTPSTIRAWREENELAGREIMRDGQWLA